MKPLENLKILSFFMIIFILPTVSISQAILNNGAYIKTKNNAAITIASATDYGITNRSGATMDINSNIQMDGSFTNQGTCHFNASNISVKNDLINTGTLNFNTSTITLNGTSTQNINTDGSNLYNLNIDKSSGIAILSNHLRVNNQLSFTNGILNTTVAYILTLDENATISGEGTGKYVKGKLQMTKGINNSTVDFGSLGVNINATGVNLGNTTILRNANLRLPNITYGINDLDTNIHGIDCIWNITSDNIPSDSVTLTLNWIGDWDNGNTNYTAMQVWKSTNSGATWEKSGLVQDATGRSISVTTNSFSDWTVADDAHPLPIQLLSFNLEKQNRNVKVIWQTASENNSKHFTIYRSSDGKAFETIGIAAAAGFSTSPKQYEHIDLNAADLKKPVLFYRLSETDIEGDETFYPAKSIYFDNENTLEPYIYSDINSGTLQLVLNSDIEADLYINLLNSMGQTIINKKIRTQKGLQHYEIETNRYFTSGVYFLQFNHNTKDYNLKFNHTKF